MYIDMLDELDSWRELNFLKGNCMRVIDIVHIRHSRHKNNVKVILKVVRKRWKS